MKLLSMVCASVVAFAGFALSIDGAMSYPVKVKSHSNSNNNRDAGCPAGDTATTGPTTKTKTVENPMGGDRSCGTPGNGVPAGTNSDSSRTSVMPSVGGLRSGESTTGNSPPNPTPVTATPLNNRSNVAGAAQPSPTTTSTPPPK